MHLERLRMLKSLDWILLYRILHFMLAAGKMNLLLLMYHYSSENKKKENQQSYELSFYQAFK